jgi:nitroreductase
MKRIIIEILNSGYDTINFLKYSFKESKLKNKEHYVAFLTKQYHIIEKGMTLPKPRVGFGEKKIEILLKLCKEYIEKYGEDNLTEAITSTLEEYVLFNFKYNHKSKLIEEIKIYLIGRKIGHDGGTKKVMSSEFKNNNFEGFFKSRFSIRDFSDTPIPNELLLKATEIARYTPSVCNRQGWHAHIYSGSDVKKILSLQNGNNGFTDSIKSVAIITSNIHFFTNSERNQISIDGGMFAMSYILALHSLDIGTCALNACVSMKTEKRIKEIANISTNEKVIMFIGIGFPKSEYKVAQSSRRAAETFVTFHSSQETLLSEQL